jgi:hypothetical protein
MSRRRHGFIIALGLSAHGLIAEPGSAREPAAGPDIVDEPGATADAAVVAKAEAYASAAYEAYLRKEYAQAVVLYEQALSEAPNAALVLYNIARIYDVGLHSRGLAIDYYHRFIAAPGATPEHILSARARIAELEIAERAAVNQTIAAQPAPPSEPTLPSDPGKREALAATTPTELSVPAVEIERMAVAPASNPPIFTPPEKGAWSSREIAALAVGGAGAASLGLGIGFLLSARAKSDIWKRDCDGNSCSTQRAVDAAQSASRQVAIGTAGLFAGGALLGLGGVFWLVDFSSAKPVEGSAASSSRSLSSSLSLSPVVGNSEISAALSGHF